MNRERMDHEVCFERMATVAQELGFDLQAVTLSCRPRLVEGGVQARITSSITIKTNDLLDRTLSPAAIEALTGG